MDEISIPLTKKDFLEGKVFEVDSNHYRVTSPLGIYSAVERRNGDVWKQQCVYNWKTNTLDTSVLDMKIRLKPIFRK